MAILRILISLSFIFISIEVLADNWASSPEGQSVSNIPQVNTIMAQAASFGVHAGSVQAAVMKLNAEVPSCESKKKYADLACIENNSVPLLKFVSENGQLLSMGLLMGSSIGDQCKGLANALSKANMALGAYQAACKIAQEFCSSSCTSVTEGIAATKAAAKNASLSLRADATRICAKLDMTAELCVTAQELAAKAEQASTVIDAQLLAIKEGTGEKNLQCATYKISAQQAVFGAATTLKGFIQAKNCEKANSDVSMASIDCTKPNAPGYSTPNCQCARGEKSAAECQGINVNIANIKQDKINMPSSTGLATESAGSPSSIGDVGTGSDKVAAIAPHAGGSAPPADGGGGGAGLGGGGGSNGYSQDGAGAPRRLNTNILGGGFGGGGGGSGNGSGPGYGEVDSKLKDYMPGGSKDPNRSIASQLAKEVTPQAGRTNWEKVRLRYRDNLSSLLNK